MSHRLPVVTFLLLLAAPLFAAATGGPQLLDSESPGVGVTGVAISPTGGQLIYYASPGGYRSISLKSDGTTDRALTNAGFVGICRFLFTPGGRHVVSAPDNGVVGLIDRTTWTAVDGINVGNGHYCNGLYLIENPPLAFATYSETGKVSVVRWKSPMELKETLTADPAYGRGYGVCASDDGRRVFFLAGTSAQSPVNAQPVKVTLFGLPRQAPELSLWRHDTPYKPNDFCIGPDPGHLLVPLPVSQELRLLDANDGAQWVLGAELPGFDTTAIKLTPDGAFAVLVDYTHKKLKVLSGVDLRGRLTAPPATQVAQVRQADLDLEIHPQGLAVHPTLPIAYVWSNYDKRIDVIKLAIPGV